MFTKARQIASKMTDLIRAFFIVIAIVATTGNVLVLLLFLKKRAWLQKIHNCLIFALALQDVLTAFFIAVSPSLILSKNHYKVPENAFARELYCRLVWSQYLVFSLGITSIYTGVAFSFERWLAVFKPMFYKNFARSRFRVAALVLLPWLLAFAIEVGTVVRVKNRKTKDGSNSFVCFWDDFHAAGHALSIFQAVFRFSGIIVIPGTITVIAYIQIINRVRKSRNNVTSLSNGLELSAENTRNAAVLRRTTIMAFLASFSVVLFWLPSQFHFMLVQLDKAQINSTVHTTFKLFAFSNSCLNPFIYCFSKASYRKGFKEIFLQFIYVLRACSRKESV